MIRVFGVAGLRAVLPNSDDPKMSTRIKNIQRKIRKLKESKSAALKKGTIEKDERDSGESEEEDEEGDGNARRRSHQRPPSEKLIIKEGVVDFLDPKNMTASLISKKKEIPKLTSPFTHISSTTLSYSIPFSFPSKVNRVRPRV